MLNNEVLRHGQKGFDRRASGMVLRGAVDLDKLHDKRASGVAPTFC